MARLSIVFSYDHWWAIPSNSSVHYRFVGANTEEEYANVQSLQNAMTFGQSSVEQVLPRVLDGVTEESMPQVVEQLYVATDELFFNTVSYAIFTSETTLWNDIIRAGEALGEFV